MKIKMSHKQAAYKIKHWYLIHHGVLEIGVTGKETFTLFDKMNTSLQKSLLRKIDLGPGEIPVLTLRVGSGRFIINTTERFIRVTPFRCESVPYNEFDDFTGHKNLYTEMKIGRSIESQRTNAMTEVGIKKVSGDLIFWKIPAGVSSYLFWNVTRQVNMIEIE